MLAGNEENVDGIEFFPSREKTLQFSLCSKAVSVSMKLAWVLD